MARTRRRTNRWYDDDEYFDYGYFPPSRPRKVEGGIESKTKRGAFGESWWAKRWIRVLENYGLGTRLQRGRSYARGGQVLNVVVAPGHVTAKVQGSRPRPYDIDIRLPVLSDAEWERAIDAMSAQALFAAKLLAGEMPQDIEEAFKAAKVSLFPARASDLRTDCSCPDIANPCKHIAAVYYLLGEQFDADPFVLFTLRGQSREQIVEALRSRRAAAVEAEAPTAVALPAAAPTPGLADALDRFWQLGDPSTLTIHVAAPAMEAATLRRLGQAPGDIDAALREVYHALTEIALQKITGE